MKPRVVLITGANGGLGSFVTEAFLKLGDQVIGASRKISAADFAASNFEALELDLTSSEEIRAAVAQIVSKHGGIDVLVHVLGGFAGGDSIADTSDATWDQMQLLNVTAAFRVLRETIPHLRKSGHGRIVAIGSLAAKEAQPKLGAYVVSKQALAALIQTVAAENADAGVTANLILPGTMDTPANRKAMPKSDFSKWLNPGDVADLVLFLADERSGQINGAAIPIDGKA